MTKDLVRAALNDVDQLRARLETLLSSFEDASNGKNKVLLKQPNGRLTEAGLRQLRNMIDAGRSDSAIARELDITQPAVNHQRQRYLAERFAPKHRR